MNRPQSSTTRELVLRQGRIQPRVSTPRLRALVTDFLEQDLKLGSYALGIHLVGERSIAQLNERHLQHAGPTDVLAFDYSEETPELDLHGEIFVCSPVAVRQANQFHTAWPEELVRYVVHGILHLQGYDDRTNPLRQRMKQAENRWMRHLKRQRKLGQIPRP